MFRFWRVAGILTGLLVIALVGLVFRTLNTAGVFADVTPVSAGVCRDVAGVIGAEDMQSDAKSGLLYISATDRRAPPDKPNPQDGIYIWKPGGDAPPLRLSGTPADFHPHGLSLYRAPDGSLTLMVVNHPASGERARIEIFDVGEGTAPSLYHRASVSGDQLRTPNDVVAVGKDRFYATNDHGSQTSFGVTLENYLILPRASVVYYDGDVFHTVAKDLSFANGINVSPDYAHLYVAQTTGRQIETYARDVISGELTHENSFEIQSALDNIDVDSSGNLWVASHPKMFALVSYMSDPKKPSPSEVTQVTVAGGIPVAAKTVFENDGTLIGASSVGVFAGGHLYIGSVFDPKILDCKSR